MPKTDSTEVVAKQIIGWLNTDEGKKAMRDSIRQADEAIAQLKKSHQADWHTLHTPFGPADGSSLWPHQRV